MAVTDRLRDAMGVAPDAIPGWLIKRLDGGRNRMKDGAAIRNECMEFFRGNQYVYRHPKGSLMSQDTVTNFGSSGGKPPHRMRTTRNLIVDVIQTEVSASTQRVPSYEVSPSKTDSDVVAAAKLAEKVALFGYDKWRLQNVTAQVVTYAAVSGEGFAWPFWDESVGPFAELEGGAVGLGEVCVRILGPNEVYWEPGQRFEDSAWHAVEQARSVDDYPEAKLIADSDGSDVTSGPERAKNTNLALVTDYLEKPSLKTPKGKWLTVANKRVIKTRDYPCTDSKGRPLSEPVLHKLSYFLDADNDRDFGIGKHLIDPQRTVNDCNNKLLEWKNVALNPQVVVSPGLLKRQRITDEPGAVYEIPQPKDNLVWRPTPNIPQELFQMLEEAKSDIARIAAQNDIPQGVESGKGIEALIEKDQARRAGFIAQLAEFHSRLMRHCLYLVQKHYTEGRLLKLQGRFGPELISGFQGADLMGQADVRVPPGSIEPRTRAAIEQKVLAYADRGWVQPQAAMAAINGGTAEKLIESYELDVARANRIIRLIMEDPEALLSEEIPQPDQEALASQIPQDPMAGDMQDPNAMQDPRGMVPQESLPPEPMMPPQNPSWMPRPFDNIEVHKAIFEDWMKTLDYEESPPPMKEVANLYYEGLEQLEAEKMAKEAQAQMAMAEGLGMENAAKPQDKGMPSQPGPEAQGQPPQPS